MRAELALVARRVERLDRRVLFLALNLFALAGFFFVAFRYNYLHPDNMGRLMFSTPDTRTYKEIAEWLSGSIATPPVSTRLVPFLYPLFLASVWQVTRNPYVFWAVQFLLWLASVNLVALAVFRLTKRHLLLVIAFCVMALNVSAIVLTFYAMTETMSIFLWSLWLALLSRTNLRDPAPRHVVLSTFLLSLLTVVKTIFQLHLLVYLALVFRQGGRHAKRYLGVGIALLPVVIQVTVNLYLNGVPGVSNITEYTVTKYLLPQVHSSRYAVSLEQARSLFTHYDAAQSIAYLAQDPISSAAAFLRNVGENVTGASEYISSYEKPYVFTRVTNVAYLIVQLLLLPAIVYFILRKQHPIASAIRLAYSFSLIIILTTGIVFNEGDRLVMTALPLWVFIYACVPVLFLDGTLTETEMALAPAP